MEIFISINGVLRNLIQKFDYHYHDYFLSSELEEEEETFEYGKEGKVQNDNLYEKSFEIQTCLSK